MLIFNLQLKKSSDAEKKQGNEGGRKGVGVKSPFLLLDHESATLTILDKQSCVCVGVWVCMWVCVPRKSHMKFKEWTRFYFSCSKEEKRGHFSEKAVWKRTQCVSRCDCEVLRPPEQRRLSDGARSTSSRCNTFSFHPKRT